MPGETPSANPRTRIPVTLVTGFLGSGKTTLINAALRSPELARTVVVVNEFGEVGLDHKLFARSSDSVVVLENGCLWALPGGHSEALRRRFVRAPAGGTAFQVLDATPLPEEGFIPLFFG